MRRLKQYNVMYNECNDKGEVYEYIKANRKPMTKDKATKCADKWTQENEEREIYNVFYTVEKVGADNE